MGLAWVLILPPILPLLSSRFFSQWVEENGGASKVGPLLVRRLILARDGTFKGDDWKKPTVEPPVVSHPCRKHGWKITLRCTAADVCSPTATCVCCWSPLPARDELLHLNSSGVRRGMCFHPSNPSMGLAQVRAALKWEQLVRCPCIRMQCISTTPLAVLLQLDLGIHEVNPTLRLRPLL